MIGANSENLEDFRKIFVFTVEVSNRQGVSEICCLKIFLSLIGKLISVSATKFTVFRIW